MSRAKVITIAFIITVVGFLTMCVVVAQTDKSGNVTKVAATKTSAVKKKPTSKKPSHKVSSPKPKPKQPKQTMNESDAEEVCQSEANIKLQGKNISVIDIWNYNKYYTSVGYDKTGYPLMQLTWNGKDKDTDTDVSFACIVSGQKKDNNIHYLSMDTDVLDAEAIDKGTPTYNSYTKDGTLVK